MRKLSGILAGSLALTLVFGMTTFAAPSKSTSDVDNSSSTTKTVSTQELESKGYTEEKLKADGVDSSKATIVATTSTQNATAQINASEASEAETTSAKVTLSDVASASTARTSEIVNLSKNVKQETSTATLANGLVVQPTISSVSTAVASKVDEVAKQLANSAASNDGKDATNVTVKAAADISFPGISAEALAKGVSVTIDFGFTKQAGKSYSLLHIVNGVAQTEKITNITPDGKVTATITSASPFVVSEYVLVESDDDDDSDNGSGSGSDNGSSLNGSGKVASPKTGEAVPFAGIMAVIAAAGAAVAVKKVRYNN